MLKARPPVPLLLVPVAIVILLGGERSVAQQPLRSGFPARPSISIPPAPNLHPAAHPQFNNAPSAAAPNNLGFNANSGFNPPPLYDRSFNDFGYTPWNYGNWNPWTGYTPYWNAVLSINTVNPAMNWQWAAPAWPMWYSNPYLFNTNFNPAWNTVGFNPMWNNFNMYAMWNNPFWQGGVPVGNWNPMIPQVWNPAFANGLNPNADR